jgi:dTDP-4-dehydrorhamnose reductase
MTKTIKVMLTGKDGQLGKALVNKIPAGIEVVALGRQDLDLSNKEACHNAVLEHRPEWVLNAGAYTAVDRAESEPELAMAINAVAPEAFAQALGEVGGRILQVSTDFVFNGTQGHPYHPDQTVDPISVYGTTKAEGERLVQKALPATSFCILRTSWVYGPVGNNFCLTMLRLHHLKSAQNETLNVVADQIGCPTSALTLACACWSAINHGASGIHHFSDAGAASWYDFAIAIGEAGVAAGVINQSAKVVPITSSEYPTPAKRPGYSLLDCTATWIALELEINHWQKELSKVIAKIPKST